MGLNSTTNSQLGELNENQDAAVDQATGESTVTH